MAKFQSLWGKSHKVCLYLLAAEKQFGVFNEPHLCRRFSQKSRSLFYDGARVWLISKAHVSLMTLWRTHIRLKVIVSGNTCPGTLTKKYVQEGSQYRITSSYGSLSFLVQFFYLGPGCCMWIMSAVTQQNLLLTGKLTLKTSCTHPSQFFFCCAAGVIAGDGGVLLCAGAAEPSFTLPNWVCNVLLLSFLAYSPAMGSLHDTYAQGVECFGGWI
jgi:hypothetical protein